MENEEERGKEGRREKYKTCSKTVKVKGRERETEEKTKRRKPCSRIMKDVEIKTEREREKECSKRELGGQVDRQSDRVM